MSAPLEINASSSNDRKQRKKNPSTVGGKNCFEFNGRRFCQ